MTYSDCMEFSFLKLAYLYLKLKLNKTIKCIHMHVQEKIVILLQINHRNKKTQTK